MVSSSNIQLAPPDSSMGAFFEPYRQWIEVSWPDYGLESET